MLKQEICVVTTKLKATQRELLSCEGEAV